MSKYRALIYSGVLFGDALEYVLPGGIDFFRTHVKKLMVPTVHRYFK